MNPALRFFEERIGQKLHGTPSPFMQWLDPVLVEATEGRLTFAYIIRPEMTNPIGTLHGGVIAAIIDDAIGATMFSLGESHFYTTLNNVIDYFAPAWPGQEVLAITSLIKRGKQIVHAQCEIRERNENKLLARGISNLMRTDRKKEINT